MDQLATMAADALAETARTTAEARNICFVI